MDSAMESWMGSHLDEVILQWGYPDAEVTIADRHLYYWDRRVSYLFPGTTTGTASVIGDTVYYQSVTNPPATVYGQCRKIFEVDQNNRIINWQYDGNDCCVMTISGHCGNLPKKGR